MTAETTHQVKSGESLFGQHSVYDYFRVLPHGLLIDVGAGAGGVTGRMLRMSPKSRVMAFEPFPGNLPFIEETIGDDPRVGFHHCAVGAASGEAEFVVGQTVKGTEPGWETMVGYSSGGFLAAGAVPDGRATIKVPVVALDDRVKEHVVFLKIDVQGGELGVLEGAASTIERYGVDVIYCEYSGQPGVLEFLFDRGFHVFYTEHLIVPRLADDDLSDWRITGQTNLSSGRVAYLAWPRDDIPLEAEGYAAFMGSQRPKRIACQTDIVCISSSFVGAFRRAAELGLAASPA